MVRSCLGMSRSLENETRHARRAQLAVLEDQRRSMIVALMKIDAEIAILRDRPIQACIVIDDGSDDSFDDAFPGGDLRGRSRDEMS